MPLKVKITSSFFTVAALAIIFSFWPAVLVSLSVDKKVEYQSLAEPGKPDVVDWTKVTSLEPLELSSLSAMVVKLPSGEIVGAQEPEIKLPLASLTKLMTSVVVMENKPLLENIVTIAPADSNGLLAEYLKVGDKISLLKVKPGDEVKVKDLLSAALVGSANNAIAALARSTNINKTQFVQNMNDRAAVLGMTNTNFSEVTGLDPENTSTAYDMALLARYAWQNKLLRETSGSPQISFVTLNGAKQVINNTNSLLLSKQPFTPLASKTGYLEEAGYNLAFELRDHRGMQYLIVLLNAPSANERQEDVLKIVQWLDSQI